MSARHQTSVDDVSAQLETQTGALVTVVRTQRATLSECSETLSDWSTNLGANLTARRQQLESFITDELATDKPTGTRTVHSVLVHRLVLALSTVTQLIKAPHNLTYYACHGQV